MLSDTVDEYGSKARKIDDAKLAAPRALVRPNAIYRTKNSRLCRVACYPIQDRRAHSGAVCDIIAPMRRRQRFGRYEWIASASASTNSGEAAVDHTQEVGVDRIPVAAGHILAAVGARKAVAAVGGGAVR